MKPMIWSILIASLIATTGVASIALQTDVFAAKEPAPLEATQDEHHQTPYPIHMHRPHFDATDGAVPASGDGLEELHHLYISAEGVDREGFNLTGSGSEADPYVLSGLYIVDDLYLKDTDDCFLIKENYIAGQLSLNWNGQCVHVHHNYIRDLRVNENIERTGEATGGLIEENTIGYVGQIRHYDGEFRNNVVGPMPEPGMFESLFEPLPFFGEDTRVMNVDGFNQAWFHHNAIQGSVDLDLHGHHHGSGFDADHSHNHGEGMDMGHDHTQRYHSLFFTDNQVVDPEGYGVRYDDRNHAGDDRTARSEQEEELEMPHQHYTNIILERNTIEGAPLWVDIFNADDRLHEERNPGTFAIRQNTIILQEREEEYPLMGGWFGRYVPTDAGITVHTAKEVDMEIRGNNIQYTAAPDDGDPLEDVPLWWDGEQPSAAIRLSGFGDATITVADNIASGTEIGVDAHRFDDNVLWMLSGNDFGGAEEVRQEQVSNPPQQA